MDNIAEVVQALAVSMVVANFLFNTDRVRSAIEVFKECLIYINKNGLEIKIEEFFKIIYIEIYIAMFLGYGRLKDNTSAIECGTKLLVLLHGCGERSLESVIAFVVAKLYERHYKYEKAKEAYEKALGIAIETGDRQEEANCSGNLGRVLIYLCEYDKAEGHLQKALAIRKKIGDREGEAADYGNLANVFIALANYGKAKKYCQKSLTMSIQNGDRKNEAWCYRQLGSIFQALSENAKAKELYQKALNVFREILDIPGEASCYNDLGNVHHSLGKYFEAEELFQKALKISKEIGDRQTEASCYRNIGTVNESLGNYFEAEEFFRKALKMYREICDRQGEAEVYGLLGILFRCVDQYEKAKKYLFKAIAIRKEVRNRYGESSDYLNLGNVFESLGEYAKAEEYIQKSIVIKKEIGDRGGEAVGYNSLGAVFVDLAEYYKAKECWYQALTIANEIGDIQGKATVYGNLGVVFRMLGEYNKAEESLKMAIEIKTKIGDRRGEASDYTNLGSVFRCLAQYVKAKEYLQKALAIRKETGDKQGEASVYANLGDIFASLGNNIKAQEYFEKALVIRKEIGDRQGEADDYGGLGQVFNSVGEYVEAKEHLNKALEITKEIGHRQAEASVYGHLGILFAHLSEYVKAREYLQKSLEIIKEIGYRQGQATVYGNLGTVFQLLGEYDKAKEYHNKALALGHEIADAELLFHIHVELSWDFLLEGETVGAFSNLIESIHICENMRGFVRDNDDFNICFSDEHVKPYRMLSALFCKTGYFIKALYVVELGRARALTDLMSAKYSLSKEISVNPLTWVGIERIMKKEYKCICLYISYDARNMFLWVLNAKKPIVFRKHVDISDTKGSLRDLNTFFGREPFRKFHILPQEHCEDRSLFPFDAGHPKGQLLGDTLAAFRLVEEEDNEGDEVETEPNLALYYKLIIAPVVDLLNEPEIVIVPDRSLYKVPFAALKDKNGTYLSETFRIRIVPSLTTLQLIQDRPADHFGDTNALIVGDPDVSQVSVLSRLPGARKEAEMIGRLFGVKPLLGHQATKCAVLDRINSASLIHFAAHGDAERGEIALAPLRPTKRILQPDDFLLTMSDIAQVQLRARLVVLSCCHSGCGRISAEGVVGIARAFLGSGARSVLVALWAIQDEATEQFMNCFYNHLLRGESASESLHQAMKWMRGNGFSDVRQWAPFMLIGDNVTYNFGK